MTRFRIGGSGPDGRGIGYIMGIVGRRFDQAGEIYDTDNPVEIQILRQCPYTEELIPDPNDENKLINSLSSKKMKELIKMGQGLFRVGMTKSELVNRIIDGG